MRPAKVDIIGSELAIQWEDGNESFIPLEQLRRACPCAGCKGEMDVMGHWHRPAEVTLGPGAFQLRRVDRIGSYGIQPVWADGHATGIYSFDYLKQVSQNSA